MWYRNYTLTNQYLQYLPTQKRWQTNTGAMSSVGDVMQKNYRMQNILITNVSLRLKKKCELI